MADFTILRLEGNNVTTGAPNWVDLSGAGEVRWSHLNNQKNIAAAAWPAMIRPAATAIVSYTYAYTAGAVGDGFYADGGVCPAYDKDNYLWARWWWDNLGTFASAPIFTAYPTVGHGAIVRQDGSLLGGANPDTKPGANAFSYLKGNAYGRVVTGGVPGAGPGAAPLVTSGTVGSVSPAAGAFWLADFQSLQGDNDYITAPFTPIPVTQDQWNVEFALFTGPGMNIGLHQVQVTLKYTWS